MHIFTNSQSFHIGTEYFIDEVVLKGQLNSSRFEIAIIVLICLKFHINLADAVKPRLELAGADCEKILVIDERDKSLSMADERLEEALAKTGTKVLILDPIQAYLGGGMDMNRAMRQEI